MFEDDYDSEFRYDSAPLMSLAGIDHLQRVIYMGTFAKTLFPGLRIGYCALPERLIGQVAAARAALDRFPATLMEGAVADMLNSGAFAGQSAQARESSIARRAMCSPRRLQNEIRRQALGSRAVAGPAPGGALAPSVDDRRRCTRQASAAGVEGWLLADTYHRARPLPGFVLGFSGHAVPELVASATRLARESQLALRAEGKVARRAWAKRAVRIGRGFLHCGLTAGINHHDLRSHDLPFDLARLHAYNIRFLPKPSGVSRTSLNLRLGQRVLVDDGTLPGRSDQGSEGSEDDPERCLLTRSCIPRSRSEDEVSFAHFAGSNMH